MLQHKAAIFNHLAAFSGKRSRRHRGGNPATVGPGFLSPNSMKPLYIINCVWSGRSDLYRILALPYYPWR